MFAFLHYNGSEPGWATALLDAGLPAYSPARTMKEQADLLEASLSDVKPNTIAYQYADAFKLSDGLWKPFTQVKSVLFEADRLISTEHCIWRDQWLLSRSDVLIVESGASLEIPTLAYLLDIRTVAVSFSPVGINPWLAKAAHVTVNSPENAGDILSVIGINLASFVDTSSQSPVEEA